MIKEKSCKTCKYRGKLNPQQGHCAHPKILGHLPAFDGYCSRHGHRFWESQKLTFKFDETNSTDEMHNM